MRTRMWVALAVGLGAAPALARSADKPELEAHAVAGLLAFPGQAASFLNPGLSYGAGLSLAAPQLVGVEVNYQGATYGTKAGVVGPRESVIENGGEALLKLGPKTRLVDVYALGGYGLTWVNVAQRSSVSPVQDDTLSKVPVGLGVDLKLPSPGGTNLVMGARSSYDFLFNNKAYPGLGPSYATDQGNNGRSADQINTQLMLGGEF